MNERLLILTQKGHRWETNTSTLQSRLLSEVQEKTFGGIPHLGVGIIYSEARSVGMEPTIGPLDAKGFNMAKQEEFGFVFMSAMDLGLDVIRTELRKNPTLIKKTMVGGQGVSNIYKEIQEEFPGLSVFLRRSEGKIADIIEDLRKDRLEPLYRQSIEFSLANAGREPYLKDRITFRDLTLFRKSHIKPVEFNTGCTQNCDFCPLTDEIVSQKPLEVLLGEIDQIGYKFGDILTFIDHNLFNVRQDVLIELFKQINKRKIIWAGEGSIIQAIHNDELLKLMSKNCLSFLAGLEDPFNPTGGSPAKSKLQQDFPDVLSKLRKLNLPITWSLVFPLDNQTRESYLRTARFIKEHKLNANLHLLQPRPGSQLSSQVINEGRLISNDSRFRDGLHLTHIPVGMPTNEAMAGYIWLKNKFTSVSWMSERFDRNMGENGLRVASALMGLEIVADRFMAKQLLAMYPQYNELIQKYENDWKDNNF